MENILKNTRTVDEILADMIEPIVGDMPVSMQIATALEQMANKDDVIALRKDVNALRKEVSKLIELVGDISVSEQINMAINKSEN